MFNGQFRLHENLMYEKKLAKVNFAESLQWPIYNYTDAVNVMTWSRPGAMSTSKSRREVTATCPLST